MYLTTLKFRLAHVTDKNGVMRKENRRIYVINYLFPTTDRNFSASFFSYCSFREFPVHGATQPEYYRTILRSLNIELI